MPSPTPTVDPLMFLVTSLQFVICFFGLAINGFLAFVLLRNRPLRTPCGILILWLVVFDVLTEFSLISTRSILTFSGLTIPLMTCFWVEWYCPFANTMSQWVMLLISVDRLHAVLFPINYKNEKSRYKFVVFGISSTAIITLSWQGYFYFNAANANPDKPVFCQPTDFMGGIALTVGQYIVGVQNIATILVYLLIWTLLSFVNKIENKSDQRVLNSLFVLMAIVFVCWLPSSVIGQLVVPWFQMSATTQNATIRLALLLNKIGQLANAPVLYMCSSEYRHAIRKELAKLFGQFGVIVHPNIVVPMGRQHTLRISTIGDSQNNNNRTHLHANQTMINNFMG